jgi:hypothetical protein
MMKKIILVIAGFMAGSILMAADKAIKDEFVVIKGGSDRITAEKKELAYSYPLQEILNPGINPMMNMYHYEPDTSGENRVLKVPAYKPLSPLTGIAVQDIARAPDVYEIIPANLSAAKLWKLSLLDSRGVVIREYKGFTPPMNGNIVWDGKDDAGKILKAGMPYSYMFAWSREPVQEHPYAQLFDWNQDLGEMQKESGQSFKINSLFYKDHGIAHIHLARAEITGAESDVLNESLLKQTALLIKEHFKAPVHIRVYDKDKAAAQNLAEDMRTFFCAMLIIPQDVFQCEGYVTAEPWTRAEIDMVNDGIPLP